MKMLVCIDGSESSQKAVKEAARIAENLKEVEINILNVYEESPLPAYGVPDEMQIQLLESKEKEGEEILQEAVKVFEAFDLKPKTILKRGHPSSTIIKIASENNFDLIVVGKRGLSGFKKFILGSVSNAVVQEAKTNVLVVKP